MDPNPPPPAGEPASIVPGLDARAADALAAEGSAPPPVDAAPAPPHGAEIGTRGSLPPWLWIAALAIVVALMLYAFTG